MLSAFETFPLARYSFRLSLVSHHSRLLQDHRQCHGRLHPRNGFLAARRCQTQMEEMWRRHQTVKTMDQYQYHALRIDECLACQSDVQDKKFVIDISVVEAWKYG